MEVAMSLPVRTFTVMSVIEDENTSAWLLLRESGYYCQAEVEKVLQRLPGTRPRPKVVGEPHQAGEEGSLVVARS